MAMFLSTHPHFARPRLGGTAARPRGSPGRAPEALGAAAPHAVRAAQGAAWAGGTASDMGRGVRLDRFGLELEEVED